MWSVVCGLGLWWCLVWCVVFGVWFGVRVRCVVSVCGVWSVVVVPVVCGGLWLVCGVWCVVCVCVCGVWCVVCCGVCCLSRACMCICASCIHACTRACAHAHAFVRCSVHTTNTSRNTHTTRKNACMHAHNTHKHAARIHAREMDACMCVSVFARGVPSGGCPAAQLHFGHWWPYKEQLRALMARQ